MKKYTSKEILENLNEQGILTRNDYTFVEYVDQLMKFQEATAKLVIGEENAHLVKQHLLYQVYHVQCDNAHPEGLSHDHHVPKRLSVPASCVLLPECMSSPLFG